MSENAPSELYISKTAVPVKSDKIYEDQKIGTPFQPTTPLVSVDPINIPTIPPEKPGVLDKIIKRDKPIRKEPAYTHLAQITYHQGRSLTDTRIENQVFWGGKYPSDVYGSIDYKGTIANNPEVTKDPYSPYGFRTEGLKDNVGIERIIKTSKYLRSQGLPTELPTRIYKIEEIIKNNRRISVDEWKKQYLENLLNSAKEAEQSGNKDKQLSHLKKYRDIHDYFDSAEYFIMERELQTGIRLRYLEQIRSDNFKKEIAPIFNWVNVVCEQRNSGIIPDTPKPKRFNVDDEGINNYFGEWLPKQMGTYLARMHNLGLAHGYTHAQNWSVVGTLYDLDSVHGTPLNDTAVTENDFTSDTNTTMGSIFELFHSGYLAMQYQTAQNDAIACFATSYIQERFGKNLSDQKLEDIKAQYFNRGYSWGMSGSIPTASWEKVKEANLK